jgi:LMBR1 domain-containing protein 1
MINLQTVLSQNEGDGQPTSLGYWLIALMVGVPLLMIFFNILIIRYYNDKEDNWKAYFPKTIAVLALTFAEAAIFLLPLDVANGGGAVGCGAWLDSKGLCGNLRLDIVWQFVVVGVIVFVVFLIPFAISYYQAYDVDLDGNETLTCSDKICRAFKWQVISFIILAPIMFIMYAFLNKTAIPLYENTKKMVDTFEFNEYTMGKAAVVGENWKGIDEYERKDLRMATSFPIYVIAAFSFLGSVFFVMYAGIGLIAIPMDFILGWKFRPQPMEEKNFIKYKIELGKQAKELNDLGEMMKKEYRSKTRDQRKKSERADKKAMKQFKLALLQLEKDWEETKLCEQSAYFKNPSLLNTLWPWIQLFLGIISSILSFFWILHICLFQLPVTFGGRALTPFLNSYFQSFDSWFPLFGVISVGMFTFYMLLAVMLGNFKFGMRILIIPLHPMIKGKTLMNTILFNINLIMLCTIPTLQFSVDAFQEYARLTDINTIINVQIRYLEFYQFFYSNNIFVLIMLGFTVLAFVYWILCGCCCGKVRTNEVAKKKLQKDLEKVRQKYKKEGLKNKKKKVDRPLK